MHGIACVICAHAFSATTHESMFWRLRKFPICFFGAARLVVPTRNVRGRTRCAAWDGKDGYIIFPLLRLANSVLRVFRKNQKSSWWRAMSCVSPSLEPWRASGDVGGLRGWGDRWQSLCAMIDDLDRQQGAVRRLFWLCRRCRGACRLEPPSYPYGR